MAKIPSLGGGGQIAVNPGQVASQSVGQAGMVGKAISGLAGQAIKMTKELDARRNKAEVDNFKDKATMDFYLEADTLKAQAQKDPKYSESAVGYSDDFRGKLDKLKGKYLKDSPSSEASNAFSDSVQRYELSSNLGAQDFERKTITTQYRNNRVESGNKLAFQAYLSPDPIENAVRMEEHLLSQETAIGNEISADEHTAMSDKLRTNVLNSNIEGMLEGARNLPSDGSGDSFARKQSTYESIRNMVHNDDQLYKALKTPEQKAKALKYINDRQQQDYNLEIQRENQERKRDKIANEEEQDNLMQEIVTGSLEGGDIEKEARKALKNGSLSIKNFKILRNDIANPDEKETSQAALFNTGFRLSNGGDVTEIKQQIMKDVLSGTMMDSDGIKALAMVKSRSKASQTPAQKKRLKNSDDLMKSAFINPIFKLQQDTRLLSEANIERDAMIGQGVDPIEASRAMIKKYKGDLEALPPIPGLRSKPSASQSSDDYYKEGAFFIRNKLKSGSMTKKDAIKYMGSLKERIKALETQDFPNEKDLIKEANQ